MPKPYGFASVKQGNVPSRCNAKALAITCLLRSSGFRSRLECLYGSKVHAELPRVTKSVTSELALTGTWLDAGAHVPAIELAMSLAREGRREETVRRATWLRLLTKARHITRSCLQQTWGTSSKGIKAVDALWSSQSTRLRKSQSTANAVQESCVCRRTCSNCTWLS